MREWKTVSVKVDGELRRAMDLICKRRDITANKLLTELITREVEPILDPNALPQGQGISQVGENRFKYFPESDSFVWQIDLGANGVVVLSEGVLPTYLENLRTALDAGLNQREDFHKKKKEGATAIPPKLLKYGVKKNVST